MDIACRSVHRVRTHYDVPQPFLSYLRKIAGVIALGARALDEFEMSHENVVACGSLSFANAATAS